MGIFEGKSKDVAVPAAPEQDDALSAAATRLLEKVLDVGIDGKGPFASAHQTADKALRATGGNPDKAVDLLRREHRRIAMVGGFATGLGGFFTLPISLPANVLEYYLVSARMTAAMARVRGYDIDAPEIRSAVLLTLAGADGDEILRKAGVVAGGGGLASVALKRLPAPALMVLNKAIAFRLVSRVGKSFIARLGRFVPFVGGLIGGALDGFLISRIAKQSSKEFPPINGLGR